MTGGVRVLMLIALLSGCGAATASLHDDPSIATRVKIALLNDAEVGGLRLDARSAAGVVTLAGTVRTQADVDRAVAAARRVPGVKDVRSDLKVGGSQ